MDEKDIGPEITFPYSQWCVFVDRGTGEIVHTHEYLLSSQDDRIPQEDLEEQAREVVGDRLRGEHIRVVHAPDDIQPERGSMYGVDLHEGRLFVVGKSS
jgi:hypothetical protein